MKLKTLALTGLIAFSFSSVMTTYGYATNETPNALEGEEFTPEQQPLVWFAIPVLLAFLGSEIFTDQAAYAPTLADLPCGGVQIPDIIELEKMFPPLKEDGTFDSEKYQTACAVIKSWKQRVSKNPQTYPGIEACLNYQADLFKCPIDVQATDMNQVLTGSL